MTMTFSGTVDLGRFVLNAEFTASAGETIALVGPNGSGKTTVLSATAGLRHLSAGSIVVDGRPLDDSRLGVFVPPERRQLGVVFQDLALFPHMTVVDNVAYGLRRKGSGATAARQEARGWLDRFGLKNLADVAPGSLSGGQAQRVALARALAVQPRVLLLDESLSALDAATALEIRQYLHTQLLDFGGVTLLVTHEIVDALILADRVVELQDGRVVHQTTPDDFYRRPRTAYAAALTGTNLLRGCLRDGTIEFGPGAAILAGLRGACDGPVDVVIPPSSVRIAPTDGTPAPGSWDAPITGIETAGDQIRAHVGGPAPLTAFLRPHLLRDLDLAPGRLVRISVDVSSIHVHTGVAA